MRAAWIAIAVASGCTQGPAACVPAPFAGPPTTVSTATELGVALPQSLAFSISTASSGGLSEETPLNGPAIAIAAFPHDATTGWDFPALRPDGLELFARDPYTGTISSSTFAGGAWSAPATVAAPFPAFACPSTPVAFGANGDLRMMIWDATFVQEYARSNGTWAAVGPMLSPTELVGAPVTLNTPQLTDDGLTLVIVGQATQPATVYYAQRPSLDAAFVLPATAMLSGVNAIAPYLTTDCRELYVVDTSANVLVRYGM